MRAMTDAMRAEWSKLRTSRFLWWLSAFLMLVSVGVALVMSWSVRVQFGAVAGDIERAGGEVGDGLARMFNLDAGTMASGVTDFGLYLVAGVAIVAVTGEYATGVIRSTALAVPDRTVLVAAKTAVAALWSSALVLVSAVAAVVTAKLVLPGPLGGVVNPFGAESLRVYWVAVVGALLMTLLGTGLGFLLRNTTGAVMLLLFWRFVAETVLPFLPRVGEVLAPWRPFAAFTHFIAGEIPAYGATPVWGAAWIGLPYFAAWVLVIFVGGLVLFRRRDV